MSAVDLLEIYTELRNGGEWLAASRRWLQSNIRNGDTLKWSSGEMVQLPFCKFEELAIKVATAAVAEERRKVAEAVRRAQPESVPLSDAEIQDLRSRAVAMLEKSFPHEDLDRVAAGRFKVVKSKATIFPYSVVAGDGEQELFSGSESTCKHVARKLTGAFLDGAFYADQVLVDRGLKLSSSSMAERLMGWPLPKTFSPDGGISFDGRKDDEWNKNKQWPTGTNLLTHEQAKEMFEYVMAAPVSVTDAFTTNRKGFGARMLEQKRNPHQEADSGVYGPEYMGQGVPQAEVNLSWVSDDCTACQATIKVSHHVGESIPYRCQEILELVVGGVKEKPSQTDFAFMDMLMSGQDQLPIVQAAFPADSVSLPVTMEPSPVDLSLSYTPPVLHFGDSNWSPEMDHELRFVVPTEGYYLVSTYNVATGITTDSKLELRNLDTVDHFPSFSLNSNEPLEKP